MDLHIDNTEIMGFLQEAGRMVIAMRDEAIHNTRYKAKDEIVSSADNAAQELLIKKLTPIFTEAIFVAEENSEYETRKSIQSAQSAEWSWIIDPIDGTSNYLSGSDKYGIQVALAHKGKVIAAWIHAPLADKSVYTDTTGKLIAEGFKLADHANSPANLADLNFVIASGDFLPEHKNKVSDLSKKLAHVRGTESCAIDYIEILEGKQDVLVYRRTLPWDHAPGAFLIQAASGHVCRYDASQYHPFDNGVGILVCRSKSLFKYALNFSG